MIICNKCKIEHAGVIKWCDLCLEKCRRYYAVNRERCIAATRACQKRKPHLGKLRDRKKALKRYGLTIAQYEEKVSTQGGVCAACGKYPVKGKGKKLHVDHCHKTGKIRGLLCHSCNISLGAAEDDIETLQNLIKYLEYHVSD